MQHPMVRHQMPGGSTKPGGEHGDMCSSCKQLAGLACCHRTATHHQAGPSMKLQGDR